MMGNILLLQVFLSLAINFIVQNRLDDLLVGAPLYSVRKDGRIIADAGRVDIFYQTIEVCVLIAFHLANF